jgi:ribose transport system substrate-binding protein
MGRKFSKKIIIVMLSLMIALVGILGACTTQAPGTGGGEAASEEKGASTAEGGTVAPKGDKYKIGLAMNELVIDFYKTIDARLKELCGEKGWEYVMTDAQGDINKQIANMEDLVAQGCDMILINSFDQDILTNSINSIVEGGTPVISIDNALSQDAKVLTTVQADNFGISEAVGEWLGDHMGQEPIRAVLISGAAGASNSIQRHQGVIAGVAEAQIRNMSKTDFQIVAQYFTDWKEDVAVQSMEDFLALNLDFNVLITEVDYEAIACKKVMDDAGKGEGVTVVAAADGAKQALELIKQGEYGATGLNLPTIIADMTIDACQEYFDGRTDFPDRIYTPAACVNESNVDEYYDPDALF